jgi:hypothetical protein
MGPVWLHVRSDVPVPRDISRQQTAPQLGRLRLSCQHATVKILVDRRSRKRKLRNINPRAHRSRCRFLWQSVHGRYMTGSGELAMTGGTGTPCRNFAAAVRSAPRSVPPCHAALPPDGGDAPVPTAVTAPGMQQAMHLKILSPAAAPLFRDIHGRGSPSRPTRRQMTRTARAVQRDCYVRILWEPGADMPRAAQPSRTRSGP